MLPEDERISFCATCPDLQTGEHCQGCKYNQGDDELYEQDKWRDNCLDINADLH